MIAVFVLVAVELLPKVRTKTFVELVRAYWVPALIFAVIPLGVGIVWTRFADATKNLNPISAGFITSHSLMKWNFGTIQQRTDPRSWVVFLRDRVDGVLGIRMLFLFIILSLGVLPKRKAAIATCLGIYIAMFMIFTNLHLVHHYYVYANGIFLIAAAGLWIVAFLESEGWRRGVGYGLLLAMVFCSARKYTYADIPAQQTRNVYIENLGKKIESVTSVDDVILMYGLDWSSELPYDAHRRALMDKYDRPTTDPAIAQALKIMDENNLKFAASVFCGKIRNDRKFVEERISRFHFNFRPVFADSQCEVYTGRSD